MEVEVTYRLYTLPQRTRVNGVPIKWPTVILYDISHPRLQGMIVATRGTMRSWEATVTLGRDLISEDSASAESRAQRLRVAVAPIIAAC